MSSHVDTARHQRLDILVLGYYGVMNAGDDLLQASLTWVLREHRLTFVRRLPALEFIHQFDLLIVGGGSIWPGFSFFQLGRSFARHLRIPFVVAGISAKRLNEQMAERTRPLADTALFFSVRDGFTMAALDHPRIKRGVDLFWSAPWFGDAPAALPAHHDLAVSMRGDAQPPWTPQALLAEKPAGESWIGWPFFYGEGRVDRGGVNDFQLLDKAGLTPPSSFSYLPLLQSRRVVTMRYHGLQIALRARKPFLVLPAELKLRHFCEDTGLEDLIVETPKELAEHLGAVDAQGAALHDRLHAVRASLLEAGLRQRKDLLRVIEGIGSGKHKHRPGLLRRAARAALRRLA